MGTFIYALDATTGAIIWKNEGTGSNYILQPHKSPAFAYVAPQGPFTLSGHRLLVAGGRSVPAAFNRHTGEELYYQLAASGKSGGAFTCANDRYFFNHHRGRTTSVYDVATGDRIKASIGEYPVITDSLLFFSGNRITALHAGSGLLTDTLWQLDIPATHDLIKAGDCLYAADSTGIRAIRLLPGQKPEVQWFFPVEKGVERLVAARGKLIAVTGDGTLMVFGNTPVKKVKVLIPAVTLLRKSCLKIHPAIPQAAVTEGYGLVMGARDPQVVAGLLETTSLRLVVYDKEPPARTIRQGRHPCRTDPFPPLRGRVSLISQIFRFAHCDHRPILYRIWRQRPAGAALRNYPALRRIHPVAYGEQRAQGSDEALQGVAP